MIHPKAMPVILTTKAEINAWLTAEGDAALTLQRPLPDGALMIVARVRSNWRSSRRSPFLKVLCVKFCKGGHVGWSHAAWRS
jgi:putative SOS response-associated peptidase YedK